MNVFYHQYDLPENIIFSASIAIDTEAMGLKNARDRLCVVQIGDGLDNAHVVHFPEPIYAAPRLKALLNRSDINKIFHFGRFDIAIMSYYLGIRFSNIFCTKIASKLSRTYTEIHGLKELCSELLGVKISKQQQSSDWGSHVLTQEQIDYAASDVLHLHKLKEILVKMLMREKRMDIASKCFEFLVTRAELDTAGWGDIDIFAH